MTEDFKDIQEKPTLTLDPFQETAVPKAEFPAMQEEPEMDETVLSEEERQMAEQFAQQIDLTDSSMILQYGIGTQKKMADFSESALENVRTKDLGEIGNLLSGVVSELKNFDEEEEKGFLGFFKKQSNKIQNMKIKYAKTEANINQICQVLENHQVQLMKDIALLDKMYDLNRTYFKELTMYIIAGKKKLKEVREGQLQVMLAKAQREVTDMTNELLKKNAETLKMATVETAKESERGIVDIETLKATNQSLISTLDEVMNIQEEGRRKRQEAEVEITRLEAELKDKMLQINSQR